MENEAITLRVNLKETEDTSQTVDESLRETLEKTIDMVKIKQHRLDELENQVNCVRD